MPRFNSPSTRAPRASQMTRRTDEIINLHEHSSQAISRLEEAQDDTIKENSVMEEYYKKEPQIVEERVVSRVGSEAVNDLQTSLRLKEDIIEEVKEVTPNKSRG